MPSSAMRNGRPAGEGIAAHSGGITLRVRKVEADQSNLDAALSGRVEILEKRLGEIEQRRPPSSRP